MPELPEVETIVADLRPHLVGRTIVRCELSFPTIVRHPEPEEFIDAVAGMQIESVGRRGKYILIRLSSDVALVVHLGMTGQLRLLDEVAPLEKHTHAVFFLDDGRQLRYRDPRRFGRLLVGSEEALLIAKKMPRLGPEPIDASWEAEQLYRELFGLPARVDRLRAEARHLLRDEQRLLGAHEQAAEAARVAVAQLAPVVEKEDGVRVLLQRRDLVEQPQLSRHAEVHDQGNVRREADEDVLAPPAHRLDLHSGHGVDELFGLGVADDGRERQLAAHDGPPDQVWP